MTQLPGRVAVLIAGGGPSGLAAAIELGRRGIEVLVLEPRHTLDALRPRAKTTSVRTMEHLRRWGIADRLRAMAPIPVSYAQDVVFVTGLFGREIVRFRNAFALTTEPSDLFAETSQQAPQAVVEECLREHLRSLPSVRFETGWRVVEVRDGAHEVHAVAVADDGRQQQIAADWLMGCEGGGSGTRAAIGANFEGVSGSLPNVNVTFRSRDLERRDPVTRAIHYWVIGASRGGLMGRLDLEGTWWAIIQGVSDDHYDPAALVSELIGEDVDVDVLATDPWQARMLLADRYRGERAFIVGDAAHLNPPWGGHGFNTCLGDAVNLAWKLAAVIEGWGTQQLLDSYEFERREVARRTIEAAGAQEQFLASTFTSGTLREQSPEGDALRADLARTLQAKDPEFHSLGLVLGYDYANSPIVAREAAPHAQMRVNDFRPSAHAGARLPHAWLEPGVALYDRLGPDFTLLVLADEPRQPMLDVARQLRIPLVCVHLNSPAVRELLEADFVLVRPDQHVAWRGDDPRAGAAALRLAVGR